MVYNDLRNTLFKKVPYFNNLMNRQQAVILIKEIFDKCQLIEGKSIKLLPPKGNNSLPNTYQVHIETRDDSYLISCIERIAKEHKLAVKELNGSCIAYEPYPNVKGTAK